MKMEEKLEIEEEKYYEFYGEKTNSTLLIEHLKENRVKEFCDFLNWTNVSNEKILYRNSTQEAYEKQNKDLEQIFK